MTSYLSLQITLAARQQQQQQESTTPSSLFFLQTTARIIDEDKIDHQQDEDEHQLVPKPPKGFTKFHRVGPIFETPPPTVDENNDNMNNQQQHSLACAIPLFHDRNKNLTVAKTEQETENENNNQQQQQFNNQQQLSLETILLNLELIEIRQNAETGKFEEVDSFKLPPITRKFPSSFLLHDENNTSNANNNNLVLDLLPIEMALGGEENNNNNQENQQQQSTILTLRLRNVTTLFVSPLASISDPGPPRLRFIGNLPQVRKTRRLLRKLYGFSHLSSVAYHSLQYVLQITNTPNESGNVVFGPKRLVALEQSISRGWGGTQPLFRFALMKKLDVSNTFFGDVGFSVILSVVHFCQRLEELNISKCGFTGRSVPLIVQTLMTHDGIEALDISCNDLMEISGEDLLRLPRNNLRITSIDASGNAFSKYVMTRLAKYCKENLDTFNQDPLNPFGMSCAYLRDVRDIPSENWGMVSELWLALTALYTSRTDKGKPDEHGDLLMLVSKKKRNAQSGEEEEVEEEVDPEGDHRERNGVRTNEDNENAATYSSSEHSDEFLIPPVATAPLLSLVWWRAFEQLVNKIEDPMVLLSFAPLAKPKVTRREIPVDVEDEGEKKQQKKEEKEGDAEDEENKKEDEEDDNDEKFITAGPQTEEEKEALKEMDELNDLLRHKARQQFETTLLRAFIIAVPFAERSWHHVEGALVRLGDNLRALGVSMVDLRRFHLALINALKVEIGENGFGTVHQTAWVQVSSLIFRKLMDM